MCKGRRNAAFSHPLDCTVDTGFAVRKRLDLKGAGFDAQKSRRRGVQIQALMSRWLGDHHVTVMSMDLVQMREKSSRHSSHSPNIRYHIIEINDPFCPSHYSGDVNETLVWVSWFDNENVLVWSIRRWIIDNWSEIQTSAIELMGNHKHEMQLRQMTPFTPLSSER